MAGMCIPKILCPLIVIELCFPINPCVSLCDREVYPSNPLCSCKDVFPNKP